MDSDQKWLVLTAMPTASPKTPRPAAEPRGTKDDDKDPSKGTHDADIDKPTDSKGQARDSLEKSVKPQLPDQAQNSIDHVGDEDQKKRQGSLEAMLEGDLDEARKEYNFLRGKVDELRKQVHDRKRKVDSLCNRMHSLDSDVHSLTTEMEELKGQI
jgi:TATA-binding protein-associated factor Taf7